MSWTSLHIPNERTEEKMSSNIKELMRGRTEGMEFALRIAKEQGIEELEREVRSRQKTGISLNVTRQELNAMTDKIKKMTLDTFTTLSIASIHDVFGFEEAECRKFMNKMEEGARYLMDDLATWNDYIKAIKDELGMDLTIRWND